MIKKIILLAAFVFGFTSLSASHLLGGEITWECQGSNSYVFTLKLYRDCTGVNQTTGNQQINWDQGTITLPFDTSYTINQQCYDPSQARVCQGGSAGSVEVFIYRSAPVIIPGTPSPSGWTFYHSNCCRHTASVNTSSNGYFIRSKMYPHTSGGCNSSPSFMANPDPVLQKSGHTINSMATLPNDGDSLYYRLVVPLQSAGTPITYNTGYTAAAPFPDMNEDPNNGPVTIDPSSGLISTAIDNGLAGFYYYSVEVECWRDYQLISSVYRDVAAYLPGSFTPNTPPSFAVDTTAFPNVNVDAQGRMKIMASLGDTVNFDMVSFDPDLNGPFPGEVTFNAMGHSLDDTWPGGGNNGYVERPAITPLSGGFTGQQSKDVNFNWVIGTEHSHGTRTSHLFNLSFRDDNCPDVAVVNRTLEILVLRSAYAGMDTVNICEGESVQLTGNSTMSNNFHWSPNIEISDTSAAEPFVNATISRYYYLTDPDNPGYVDSVYVQVEPTGAFELTYNNGLLSLTDSVNAGVNTWYYNEIPFNPPYDTLTPFGPGHYRAEVFTTNCKYFTDTIEVLPGSYSMSDPNQGTLANEVHVLTGTMGISFQLDSTASGNLHQIIIPGITDAPEASSGSDLALKLYNDQDSLLWSTDTTVAGISGGILKVSLHYTLATDEEYTLTISGDTAYAFHYFDYAKAPFYPWNNGLMVTGIWEDSAKAFPTEVSERMLPIILQIEQTIGVEEIPFNNIRIYPNPAQDQFFVEGLEKDSKLQLLDMQGKLVREINVDSESISISRNNLASGVYFLRLESGKDARVQKIIFR